jgi:exopolysaccharide transport family protein
MNASTGQGYYGGTEASSVGAQRLIVIIRRRLRLLGGVVLSVLAVSLLFIVTRPPEYTATATLTLNNKRQPVVSATPNAGQDVAPDSSSVDTEVEVLRSRTLARRVAEELHLERDPAFNPQLRPRGPVQAFRESLANLVPGRSAEPRTRTTGLEAATDAVAGGLRVSRPGMTYLINISFTASDPAQAARLANAFVAAYMGSEMDSRFSASTNASDWLSERLKQLRAQVETADTELQQYKIANNLMSSQGATLTEQEISTLDQQLALTRAQEAEASARLSTARRQLASGSTGEDVGEALSSPVIQQLRQQRAVTSKTVADLQGRYGDKHPEMLKSKRELADLDSQIQGEIQRIISNLEAQAQVARQRTASIEASVSQSRGKLVGNNRAVVKLNELQRNADAARALYETLLNRYKETNVEKGLPQTDAHVVSSASIPTAPSGRRVLLIELATLLALCAGVFAIILAELLDNVVSDGEMVETELDTSFLGSVPLLSSISESPGLINLGPERFVVERPLSSFTEAIRSVNASMLFSRIGHDTKVIAITSSLPGEGKTTSSICITRTLALSGKSVVLVDCDLRQRAVKRILLSEPEFGLLEILNNEASLDQGLQHDPLSGAMIIPLTDRVFSPRDVFGSPAMLDLLAKLRDQFDVVILDTAPVLLVTETRTVAGLADTTLLLIRWRKTTRRAVSAAIKLLKATNVPLAGAALTQVDVAQVSAISQSDPSTYYKAYRKYYSE